MANANGARPDREDRSVLGRVGRTPDDTWTYGPHADNVADIYLPPSAAAPLTPIVLIHGGFWRPEYDRSHLRPLAQALADDGRLVISLEYRRIPGDPEVTIHDLTEALAALPFLVATHGWTRFLVAGHSAGGHLALVLAQRSVSPHLTGCLPLAPVADLTLARHLNLDGGAVTDFLGQADRPDLDPCRLPAPHCRTILIHGDRDSLVPLALSEQFSRAVGTPVVVVPDCGHYELIDPQSRAWPTLLTTLDALGEPSN